MDAAARALAVSAFALTSFGLAHTAAQAQPYSNNGYIQQPAAPAGDATTVYGGGTGYGQSAPPPYAQPAPYAPAPVPAPPPPAAPAQTAPDLVQVMQNAGQFQTFLQLADVAGFTDALHRGGPYTVLAPTEAAFRRLPQGTVANMLNSKSFAISFVRFHLLQGEVRVADMLRGSQALRTLQGNVLQVATRDGRLTLNGAAVIEPDLVAQNGIVQGLAAFTLPVYPGALEGQREPGAGGQPGAQGTVAPLVAPPVAPPPPPTPPEIVPTPPKTEPYPPPGSAGPTFYR
jgi:uncharacterized surface protein with fasciclin (FAS1) repeats